MRRVLSLFLAAVMLISLLPNAIPLARAESYSGSCGENLTWTLNLDGGDTGTLTISGTGAMDDYSKGEGDPDAINPPWFEACPHMTEYEIDLVLEEGVTGIGNGAFGLTCIYSLSLPSTLERIGIAAFFDATNLQGNLDLPEGLQTIGSQAFYGCPLTRVVVPESVTQIDDYAFCNNITYSDIQIVVRNRDCILNGEAMSESVELYGWRGSTLEDYAAEYDKPFTALDELCGCGKHEYECVSLQPHTADETGSRTMYCWRCGDQYTEITPAGHVYQPVNRNHWIYTMQCMYCEDSYVEDFSQEIAVGESKTVYYPEYEEMWFRFLPEETGFYSLTADLDDYTRWCDAELYSAEGERIKSDFGGYESGEDLELNLVSRMTAGETYYYRVTSYDAVIHLNEYQPPLSGSCGPNLSWNMDLDTGLLRIEGSGKMEYQHGSPWNMLAECVTAVSLPEELESIGADAFADCANLEAVSIPERVTEICSNAFCGCNTLREIVIPKSVKRVGVNAFDLCDALERVTVKSRDCVFDYSNNTLGIPGMTVISGGAHSTACDYAEYYGYEFVAIDLCAEGVHDYELVDELAHTDTQEGWKQWRCTECGEEYTEITPAGHVYTCVSSLLCLQTMQCKYCSASYQEDCSEELLPDVERTVSVTAQEPEAWLRFTPEETGFYSLRSNANIDTYAELYQDDGQLLHEDDDGGDNTNFLITYRLQAGRTYYYKVRCYSYGAGSFAVQLSRYEPASSGSCGYALNWSFDRESGLLRITGEGEMASAPWEEFWREDITEISLPEKLSSIRYAAFSECTALQELTIPSSVKRIGWEALRGCIALRSVTVLNRRCQIDSQWGTLGDPSQTVIRGGANSTAQEFANSYGQEFEVLDLCAMGSHDYEIQEQQYHTDTEEGWRHWVCAECGAEYTETVPAGHVFTVTAYTDLWNGTKHCIYCDLSVEGDVSEALQPEGEQHFRMPDEGDELWLHFTPEEPGVYTLSAIRETYELELYDPAGTLLSSGIWNGESLYVIRRAMFPGERYYFRVRSYDDSELSTVQMTKEELVSSGTCGPNLSWRFDLETGLLTVEGTGYMEYDASVPWADLHTLIRSVSLPQGLCSIGYNAFWNCTLLEEIVIPDSVEYIHDGAFSGCSALRSVQLPASLLYIGDHAFNYCTVLTELQLPERLETIGWQAFSESGLTEIRIPSQVYSIYSDAFEGCTALREIHVAEENVYFAGVDGVLTDKAMTRLIAYPAGRAGAYTVPEGITVIGDKAFAGAAGLTAVELPESLRRIEGWAFNGCGALSEITIPMGVTEIRSGAFEACSALAGVTILSRDCRIDSVWTTLGDPDVTVIRSGNRSTAHDYAEGNGYRFEAIDLCALGCHAYEVTEQQAHTDAEPGWRVWTCAECGDSYTENTPAGHVFHCTEYSERWNGVLHCIYCDLSMEADASAELQEGSQSVPLPGEGYTLWLRCASQQIEELRLCIDRKEYNLSFMDLYVGDSEEAAAGANWTEDTVELRWLGKPGEVYHVCVGFDRRVDTAALELTRTVPAFSGVCGEDLSWRFDPDTGLLSVEGSGEMDYWESEYTVPWNLFPDPPGVAPGGPAQRGQTCLRGLPAAGVCGAAGFCGVSVKRGLCAQRPGQHPSVGRPENH